MTKPLDIAVVGGGIVGLATAHAIRRTRGDLSLTVLEKEPEVAAHQTDRNSDVIHAGLYYAPGSLKARLCTEGSARLFRYCAERGIATTRTGKIVVATSRDQLPALDELERRGTANGVAMERIGADGIAEREPHAGGIEALHVPATGAVDFGDVARALAADLARAGHEIRTGFEVREADRTPAGIRLEAPPGGVTARTVVNCAGLHVDRVMRILGHEPGLRVLPFRGEYWGLSGAAADRVRGHIYPVPDPRLPHLGVHFTRNVTGRVELGSNAVWAWGREAYGRFSGRVPDALEALSYRGFRRSRTVGQVVTGLIATFEWVEDLDSRGLEVLSVPRDHNQPAGEGGRRDQTVLDGHRPSPGTETRQEFRPAEPRVRIQRDALNPANGLLEPRLESLATLPGRHQSYSVPDFSEYDRIDDDLRFVVPQPCDDARIRSRPGRLGKDVRVNEVSNRPAPRFPERAGRRSNQTEPVRTSPSRDRPEGGRRDPRSPPPGRARVGRLLARAA